MHLTRLLIFDLFIFNSKQIREMRRHLLKKTKAGKSKPKLKDMDSSIPAAAWSILRWCVTVISCRRSSYPHLPRRCVASCTAHLEELTSEEDLVRNIGELRGFIRYYLRIFYFQSIDSTWRQFRFTIGAPDAEARFKAAVAEAQKTDVNARKYPGLYVGSPLT